MPMNEIPSSPARKPFPLTRWQKGQGQAIVTVVITMSTQLALMILGSRYILQENSLTFPTSLIVFCAWVVVVVAVAVWVFFQTLKLHIVTQVTLPKVIEFSYAFGEIGVATFDAQLTLLGREDVSLFIAARPVVPSVQEHVRLRYCTTFAFKERLKMLNGDKRLALYYEDYLYLQAKYGKEVQNAVFAHNGALREQLAQLQKSLAQTSMELEDLRQKQAVMQEENAELQCKVQMQSARQGKMDKSDIAKVPFWRLAVPFLEECRTAPRDTPYTRPELSRLFLDRVQASPDRAHLHELLKLPEDTAHYLLPDWVMTIFRAALPARIQTKGGRPSKSA